MSPPVRLALLGFTPFESDQIRATLGPGLDTCVIYVQSEDLASSSLAVVNADHEASVAEVRRQRRLHTTVVLGTTPCPGAASQLGRAFNAVALRRTLDALALATPPVSEAVQRVQQDLARLGGSRFARAPPPPQERASRAMPLIQGRASPVRPVALVVDESDITLRQLTAQLQDQDWDWLLARSAPEALERVATHAPSWVFISTGLDSIDGFHTCRMVRHDKRPPHLQPQVVLVLAQDGAVDRLRAQLAGADGVLTQPLDTQATRALLAASPATSPAHAHAGWMDRALP
jgi:CheY-like chemotaxis protein